jgi:hypothetical protein
LVTAFPDRDHDIAGGLAHLVEVGPPAQQAPEHHKLARTGHREVELYRSRWRWRRSGPADVCAGLEVVVVGDLSAIVFEQPGVDLADVVQRLGGVGAGVVEAGPVVAVRAVDLVGHGLEP